MGSGRSRRHQCCCPCQQRQCCPCQQRQQCCPCQQQCNPCAAFFGGMDLYSGFGGGYGGYGLW